MGQGVEINPVFRSQVEEILDRKEAEYQRDLITRRALISGIVGTIGVSMFGLLLAEYFPKISQIESPDKLAEVYFSQLKNPGSRIELLQGVVLVDARLDHAPTPISHKLFNFRGDEKQVINHIVNPLIYRVPNTDAFDVPPYLCFISPITDKPEFYPLDVRGQKYMVTPDCRPISERSQFFGITTGYDLSPRAHTSRLSCSVEFSPNRPVPAGFATIFRK